jgi:opacity protein-like surface antigen
VKKRIFLLPKICVQKNKERCVSFLAKKIGLLICCTALLFASFSNKAHGAFILDDLYVGVDGGWSTGLFASNRSIHGGPLSLASSSVSYGLDVVAGYHVGGNVGLAICRCCRTDLSYTYFNNPVKWQNAFFGTGTNSYDAKLQTHLVLWNAYLHASDYVNDCLGFSPYVGAGVGAAFNHLGKITERTFGATVFAHNSGHTEANFAARFGLGLLKPFCHRWALDMGFNFNYIGRAQSGKTQELITGVPITINPYKHSNIWLATFYLGLKYRIE